MKKKWLGLMVLAVLLPAVAQGSLSLFTDGSNTVTVNSWVDPLVTAVGYRYNYEIISTSMNVNWFSVELRPGVVAYGPGTTGTGQVPFDWDFMDSPATSIAALFKPQITPNGKSCVMYFDSRNAPTTGSAMVGGFTLPSHYALTGTVVTPIPEPATLALLGLGLVMTIKKRK